MKIIYFILIIVFLYLLFSKVSVVHITEVPTGKLAPLKVVSHSPQNNLVSETTKNKFNHSEVKDQPKEQIKEEFVNIIDIIKEDIDDDYYFNLPNTPVIHRRGVQGEEMKDRVYIKLIKNSIKSWPNVSLVEMKIVAVKETENEALITVLVHLRYNKKRIYFKLVYYIATNLIDGFFEKDRHITKLVDVTEVSEVNYLGI